MNFGYTPQYFPQYQQFQQPQPSNSSIYGRIIDNIANVNANDVPMDGSRALFPTSDGQAIYTKQWQADGTIRTRLFKEVECNSIDNAEKSKYEPIFARLDSIENSLQELKDSFVKKGVKRNESNADGDEPTKSK